MASTLRLPELVGEGTTAERQVPKVGADPRALASLLRYLAGKNVFTELEPGVFGIGRLGELLRDGGDLRARLDLDRAMGHMDAAWASLRPAVRTGAAGYPAVFGRGFWDDIDGDAVLAASFDEYMAGGPRSGYRSWPSGSTGPTRAASSTWAAGPARCSPPCWGRTPACGASWSSCRRARRGRARRSPPPASLIASRLSRGVSSTPCRPWALLHRVGPIKPSKSEQFPSKP